MKKILLFSLLLFGCKSTKTIESPNPENIRRKWMIIKLGNAKKSELIKNRAFIDLTQKNGSASVGCNTLGFQYEIEKNNLKAENILSTRMYCEDLVEMEKNLCSALAGCQFSIKGHKLTLTTSKGFSIECIAQDWD